VTLWTELAGLDYSVRHVAVGPWSTRVLECGAGAPFILMFRLIEGAGHWPQWEQREEFDKVVLEFLGRIQ